MEKILSNKKVGFYLGITPTGWRVEGMAAAYGSVCGCVAAWLA
jgi:hypothetical protein